MTIRRYLGLFLLLGSFVATTSAQGTNPEGIWEGVLKVGAIELRMVFHVEKDGDVLKAKFDSPDQGAKGIPFTRATVTEGKLTLELGKMATFNGEFSADGKLLKGDWKQSGQSFPLELKRVEKLTATRRPQTPKPPFAYTSEEVTFASKTEGVSLAGTLTLPKGGGPFPVVACISGSGPQDRDETIFEHRPFAVLADHLTKQGIAVLRYDDRGIGKSTGKFSEALTTDFARDAQGAVEFLKGRKEIDAKRIGLLGHSEGGLVAPLVAVETTDVGFLVLLAAPGVPGHQLLLTQIEAVAKSSGASAEEAKLARRTAEPLLKLAIGDLETEALKKALAETIKAGFEKLTEEEKKLLDDAARAAAEKGIEAFAEPWMRGFLKLDPRVALAKVRVPVLALNGEKDTQVDAKENLSEIQKTLEKAGNKAITVRELPGLNHLFQTSKTGSSEYGKIEETMAPAALDAISKWILERK